MTSSQGKLQYWRKGPWAGEILHPWHLTGKLVNVVVANDTSPTPARRANHLEKFAAPQNATPVYSVTLLATETRHWPATGLNGLPHLSHQHDQITITITWRGGLPFLTGVPTSWCKLALHIWDVYSGIKNLYLFSLFFVCRLMKHLICLGEKVESANDAFFTYPVLSWMK